MARKKKSRVAGIGALDRKIKTARDTVNKLNAENRAVKQAAKKTTTLNQLTKKIASLRKKKTR